MMTSRTILPHDLTRNVRLAALAIGVALLLAAASPAGADHHLTANRARLMWEPSKITLSLASGETRVVPVILTTSRRTSAVAMTQSSHTLLGVAMEPATFDDIVPGRRYESAVTISLSEIAGESGQYRKRARGMVWVTNGVDRSRPLEVSVVVSAPPPTPPPTRMPTRPTVLPDGRLPSWRGSARYTVAGTVCEFVADRDCRSLYGARVTLNPVNKRTIASRTDGRFAFHAVPNGRYSISISPCAPVGCNVYLMATVDHGDVSFSLFDPRAEPSPTAPP